MSCQHKYIDVRCLFFLSILLCERMRDKQAFNVVVLACGPARFCLRIFLYYFHHMTIVCLPLALYFDGYHKIIRIFWALYPLLSMTTTTTTAEEAAAAATKTSLIVCMHVCMCYSLSSFYSPFISIKNHFSLGIISIITWMI